MNDMYEVKSISLFVCFFDILEWVAAEGRGGSTWTVVAHNDRAAESHGRTNSCKLQTEVKTAARIILSIVSDLVMACIVVDPTCTQTPTKNLGTKLGWLRI